jgi:HPt (histidine-containing phosphotransfer) domain-containing protein
MDDYTSKPVKREALESILWSLLQQNTDDTIPAAEAAPGGIVTEITVAAFNRAEMLDRMDDDEELVNEIIEMTKEDLPERLTELRQALADGEHTVAMREAHTIKGVAANICAEPLREAAFVLEMACKNNQWQETAALFVLLEDRTAELLALL